MGRTRRLVFTALLVALVSSIAAPASALTREEAQFTSLINKERRERGIKTLASKGDLVAIARRHSARMARDETIYHNRNLANEVEGRWTAVGENVGMGPTVNSLHDAFMASPGHRANVLDRDYDEVGVGVVIRDDVIYVTVVFVGRPSSSGSAPRREVTSVAKPSPPKPVPARPRVRLVAAPRTLDMLLMLAGLDARRVDPATGQALGL